MVFSDWQEPARILRRRTGPPTAEQLALGVKVGLSLDGSEPHDVVAVMLEQHLMPVIWGTGPDAATPRQLDFLTNLGMEAMPLMSKPLASAWIDHLLALRTIESLQSLQLRAGDAVLKTTRWRDPQSQRVHESIDFYTVSSIGGGGLVYFKGGNGKCGWPSMLRRAPSHADPGAYPQTELADRNADDQGG